MCFGQLQGPLYIIWYWWTTFGFTPICSMPVTTPTQQQTAFVSPGWKLWNSCRIKIMIVYILYGREWGSNPGNLDSAVRVVTPQAPITWKHEKSPWLGLEPGPSNMWALCHTIIPLALLITDDFDFTISCTKHPSLRPDFTKSTAKYSY